MRIINHPSSAGITHDRISHRLRLVRVSVVDRRRPDSKDARVGVGVLGIVRPLWAPGVDEQRLIRVDERWMPAAGSEQ